MWKSLPLLDVLLRLTWLSSALPDALSDERDHRAIWPFVVGTLEVLRRVMWNFFRLENEQLHNIGGFRAVQEVPLPLGHPVRTRVAPLGVKCE